MYGARVVRQQQLTLVHKKLVYTVCSLYYSFKLIQSANHFVALADRAGDQRLVNRVSPPADSDVSEHRAPRQPSTAVEGELPRYGLTLEEANRIDAEVAFNVRSHRVYVQQSGSTASSWIGACAQHRYQFDRNFPVCCVGVQPFTLAAAARRPQIGRGLHIMDQLCARRFVGRSNQLAERPVDCDKQPIAVIESNASDQRCVRPAGNAFPSGRDNPIEPVGALPSNAVQDCRLQRNRVEILVLVARKPLGCAKKIPGKSRRNLDPAALWQFGEHLVSAPLTGLRV